ncbi:MAG: OmpA family protein, partial [Deferribacteraceae bacterium]|nr:OmpA family protein [Deferribacteraceae bacterium]
MSVGHITGGVSYAQPTGLIAQPAGLIAEPAGLILAQAQQDRYRFEITLENARSGMTTVMEVYAPSEKEARDSVVLNGWRIISMQQLTFKESVPVDTEVPELTASDYNMEPPAKQDDAALVDGLLGSAPVQNDSYTVPRVSLNAPDNSLVDELLGEPIPNAQVVIPATPAPDPRYAEGAGVYPADLPDPANLSLLATVYFDLGIIEPTLSTEDEAKLATLDKGKNYYLYGHADNVSVGANATYKDNFELSDLRAKAVLTIVEKNGMNAANVKTKGMGALYPAIENSSSAAGTAQNRRVEI